MLIVNEADSDTADQTLQNNINSGLPPCCCRLTETAQRIAADETLQGNIDANMQADTAQANADAAARALIQGDVDQNEADSDTVDQTLQNNINSEAATRAVADSTETAQRIAADETLQGNIDANMQADTAQANADAAARALIQGDVDQNEADSDTATRRCATTLTLRLPLCCYTNRDSQYCC